MEPISPIHKSVTIEPARGTIADLIAAILAGLAAVTALVYSILFFSRFLENDTHIWGIASAFLLCFGVGAFGYGPAAVISRLAWIARKKGANRRGLLWAIVLLLPWTFLSIVLVIISDMPRLYSLPVFLIVSLLAVWAVISFTRLKGS